MVAATAAAAACSGGEDGTVLTQMMAAVEVVLQGIGEDVLREGLRKTPLRVASAFQGALAGYQLSAKEIVGSALFTEAGAGGGTGCGGGSGGLVVVSNIDFFALCESCLLPFRLRCHVVYVPCGQRVVGLSKFPRVAEIFAKRLQNPQKFADELVEALNDSIGPLGVGVVAETWHLQWPAVCERHRKGPIAGKCFEERLGFGWVPVTVCAGKGQFENLHSGLWDEFVTILQLEGVDLERTSILGSSTDGQKGADLKSCPFLVYDEQGVSLVGRVPEVNCNGSAGRSGPSIAPGLTLPSSVLASAMALGVESLLPPAAVASSKQELRYTATRFVKWIIAATQGSRVSLDQGVNGCSGNGTIQNNANEFWSNGNGSLTNGGPGPENDHGLLKGSANGFSVNCWKGTAHSNGSLGNGVSRLSDGTLNIHHHVGNDSVSENPRISNGVTRYGNSATISEANSMTKGSAVPRTEVVSGVNIFSEGLFCMELDISFASLCEHHLLPFLGFVHVGYIRAKGSRPIDRLVLLKIVSMYSRRLQAQERLTRQIAEAVGLFSGSQGAIVVAEASHMCIMSRGVEKSASTTATVATIGKFSTDVTIRAAFLRRLPKKGAKKLLGH